MSPIAINYRPLPIVLATLMFGVAGAWIAFGPETSGPVGSALGAGSSLSWLAIAAVAIAFAFTLTFLTYLTRLIIGLPAIEIKGDRLAINLFPFKEYNVRLIQSIEYDEKWLTINIAKRGMRRVNARLLADYNAKAPQLAQMVSSATPEMRR